MDCKAQQELHIVVCHFSSNLQPFFLSNTGKPVNKVTQSLKKREEKRRDRKTSTSSINSVESSQRADSRASLSSRPSSRSDVSPDGKMHGGKNYVQISFLNFKRLYSYYSHFGMSARFVVPGWYVCTCIIMHWCRSFPACAVSTPAHQSSALFQNGCYLKRVNDTGW